MNWKGRIRGAPERLRRRAYPKLADLMLWLATYEARRALIGNEPIGILIDTCIRDLAVTHETIWIQRETFGAATRVSVHGADNQSERHKQASYLTALVRLVRLGLVHLWSSRSLQAEMNLHPPGMVNGYGMFDRSLFANLKIENIDGRIPFVFGPATLGFKSFAEQLKAELVGRPDEPLFQSLWSLIGPTVGPRGDQDVWHLATAERHGLDYFLTTDGKFRAAIRQLAHKEPLRSLRAKVVSPEELGELLKLRRVPPIVLSYDDLNVFVSTETTMPGQTRRKRPLKKS
jgi:hypothetical protein